MKIALPVNASEEETSVCISFGRAPFFMIYDTTQDTRIYVLNDAVDSTGGAGIKASQTLVDQSINVLLTPRCGENATAVLKAADIKIFKTVEGSAMANVEAYLSNALELLTEIEPNRHRGL